jgi:hypothetical protein
MVSHLDRECYIGACRTNHCENSERHTVLYLSVCVCICCLLQLSDLDGNDIIAVVMVVVCL